MNEIKVSVFCLAYNHGKYVEETLKGFISQKTNFKYEVIIHDDASTDNTAEIIRRYEEEYPDVIKGIYQTENKYSKHIGITSNFILPKVSGRYVAMCEGDDYWTDPYKLQKQVDALDANEDCYMCVHKTEEVFANGESSGSVFPKTNIASGKIPSREFLTLCRAYSFHTSSYMFRADEWKKYILDPPEYKKLCDVGDEPYKLHFGQLGCVYYISDCMSAYRRGVEGSWCDRNAKALDPARLAKHPVAMVNSLKAFDRATDNKYQDITAPRIASMMVKAGLLTRSSKEMLKKENRKYFSILPTKKKISVIIAAAFPSLTLGMYKKRLKKLYGKKGY